MQKLSQTEELARTLVAHARRKTLTPDQISRAMDEADYDVARLDELYEALEARGVHIAEDKEAELPPLDETQLVSWNMNSPPRAWRWMTQCTPI